EDKKDGQCIAPYVIHQENLGVAAYLKPAIMLNMLRDHVLGPERFDAALREYIQRWAYKHPTPWDFFRTMENVAGEDLGWFWRSWVINERKLDQTVKSVKYVKKIPENDDEIILENLKNSQMYMNLADTIK